MDSLNQRLQTQSHAYLEQINRIFTEYASDANKQ